MDFTLFGRLILHFWPYVVSVRQIKGLPPASFSPCLTTRTLPLAMRLPLLGSSRDFHPLTHAHAEHTKKATNHKEFVAFLNPSSKMKESYTIVHKIGNFLIHDIDQGFAS